MLYDYTYTVEILVTVAVNCVVKITGTISTLMVISSNIVNTVFSKKVVLMYTGKIDTCSMTDTTIVDRHASSPKEDNAEATKAMSKRAGHKRRIFILGFECLQLHRLDIICLHFCIFAKLTRII